MCFGRVNTVVMVMVLKLASLSDLNKKWNFFIINIIRFPFTGISEVVPSL